MSVGNVCVLFLTLIVGVLAAETFIPDKKSVSNKEIFLDNEVTPDKKVVSKKNKQQLSIKALVQECDAEFSISKCADLAFPKDVMNVFEDDNNPAKLESLNKPLTELAKTSKKKRIVIRKSSGSVSSIRIQKSGELTPKVNK